MDYKIQKTLVEEEIIPLRIAITGAGGFLGKQIIKCAFENGIDEVIAITSDPIKLKTAFLNSDRMTIVDIDDFFYQGYFFPPGTVFVNCLFPTNANGYQMADGLAKVDKCISRAKEAGATSVVNISSQSVYASKRKHPAKETDLLCLESAYAVGKYSSELYCNYVCEDMLHTNIRLSSLIGVGYDVRIANRLIIQALEGGTIKIVGGMQKYGLLDVKDAAGGIVELVKHSECEWKQSYNLGCNESIDLINLVRLIADVMEQYGFHIQYEVMEGFDNRNSSIDCNRFMQDFDWSPKITLRQSITEIVEEKLAWGR